MLLSLVENRVKKENSEVNLDLQFETLIDDIMIISKSVRLLVKIYKNYDYLKINGIFIYILV